MFPAQCQEINSTPLIEILTGNMETTGINDTIARTLVLEGGFVDNPADPGGATNMGITLNTYKRYKPGATVTDIRNLSKEDAIAVYKQFFWDEYNISTFPVDIQDVVFDCFVQYSPYTANTLIARAATISGVDIDIDGTLDNDDVANLKTVDSKLLRANLLKIRKHYYESLAATSPSKRQFLNGWLKRLDDFV